MRIAVSAGHYTEAPGACRNGFCEFPETVVWQELLSAELEALGHTVIRVPEGRLPAKVACINDADCDAAIEIHFNACGGCGASGSESLYYPGSTAGERAARAVQEFLKDVFGPDRGVKEGWYKMDRPGIKDYPGDVDGDEQPDYFLRSTNCTAIIVEPEFIDWADDIQTRAEEACEAIANGLSAWWEEEASRTR